jgi:hypothetical protein
MFPGIIVGVILAGIVAAIANTSREKRGGLLSIGEATDDEVPIPLALRRKQLAAMKIPAGPSPLKPEQERLLSLLVLFSKDKKYPTGQTRYMNYTMASEAMNLANQLGLPRTANAIRTGGPVPDSEYLPGRTESIRQLTLKYGTTGSA